MTLNIFTFLDSYYFQEIKKIFQPKLKRITPLNQALNVPL